MNQHLPLLALHLSNLNVDLSIDDFSFDERLQLNLSPRGEIACARASKPYTSVSTPGHMIKGGFTPSGKYKAASYSPPKMDKRAGK